jgi:NADPH:quinone reductase-like Zn-dependent oxidoreductase
MREYGGPECLVPAEQPDPVADPGWPEAAALPLVGLTTSRALFSRARLAPGESLLVLGAGGGVATMGVSLASAVGCTVVVTSSSQTR